MGMSAKELAPEARFAKWVSDRPVLGPVVAGFIAVQMATIVGYFLIGVGLPNVPWPLFNGWLFAPATVAKDFSNWGNTGQFFVGQSIHMIDGMVFAVLYMITVKSRLPLANTKWGNIGKGVIYSEIMAIISMGFLVPYVYAPRSGYGFFSFYSKDHWKLPLSIVIFHLVYGYFLGSLTDDSSIS
jgi:hypothetical protein